MKSIEDDLDLHMIKLIVISSDGNEWLCNMRSDILANNPNILNVVDEPYKAHQYKILNYQKEIVSDALKQALVDSCSNESVYKDKLIYVDRPESDEINFKLGMQVGKTYRHVNGSLVEVEKDVT